MKTVEDVLMETGPEVVVAPPDATATEAAELMAQAGVGSVIVKAGHEILGIFTERDLLVKVVAKRKNPDEATLDKLMSRPVKTCRLSDSIDACIATLAAEHIRHLAVVEDGSLIGVLGIRDLLNAKLQG